VGIKFERHRPYSAGWAAGVLPDVTLSTENGSAAARIEELIPAARDGSPEACGRLWILVRDYLLTIANRELPPELRAKVGGSDLVQETFIDAQRNIARFEGSSQSELFAWLRRILLNHISDVNRRYIGAGRNGQSREGPLVGGSWILGLRQPPVAGDNTPSRMAIVQEEARRIEHVLAQLPESYRQVIRLRSWDRRTFVDIGACMQCSPDAARKLWLRAIERFERLWAGCQVEP
jgi:RNA polymerase sigma-70 factor (ECF subfamily)